MSMYGYSKMCHTYRQTDKNTDEVAQAEGRKDWLEYRWKDRRTTDNKAMKANDASDFPVLIIVLSSSLFSSSESFGFAQACPILLKLTQIHPDFPVCPDLPGLSCMPGLARTFLYAQTFPDFPVCPDLPGLSCKPGLAWTFLYARYWWSIVHNIESFWCKSCHFSWFH